MTWLVSLSLSDTNDLILLAFFTGLFSYAVDYRWVKDKPDYRRETNFAKAASYFYVIGSILVYTTLKVLESVT